MDLSSVNDMIYAAVTFKVTAALRSREMGNYILKRLIQSVIVLVGVTLVVFLVLHLAGDPVLLMLPPSTPLAEADQFREAMGFNDPFLVQYLRFLKGAVTFNFGHSYYYDEPAMKLVLERLPATLKLSGTALLIALMFGIPAGILSAIKRNSAFDAIVRIIALLGQCIPVFALGLIMIIVFSVKLRWLPASGSEGFRTLIMPSICLGIFTSATITRLLRSSMLEVLGKEYIDVAKAKGLKKSRVTLKHAFKNALSPVLTVFGLQVAALFGGSVITETVFSWPGIGRLAVQSIYSRDFMVVEAVVFIMALAFILVNLVVDICYSLLNPRIKYQ